MSRHTILNLGAGVQSTTIYLLMVDGEYPAADYALFADTGEEPQAVYEHLRWLQTLNGPPIVTVSAGCLGDDLKKGKWTKNNGTLFASIPAYTTNVEGRPGGTTRRQCTREYKIEPIERWVRRELLGLKPRQRFPKDVTITHLMGFSIDEPARAGRARLRFKQIRWGEVEFPLFHEDLMMTRNDCRNYLRDRVPHSVPRSACVFCPFKSVSEWRKLKKRGGADWERAVEIDEVLRQDGVVFNRKIDQQMYVYRGCIPLKDAKLGLDQKLLFGDWDQECEGGCGL